MPQAKPIYQLGSARKMEITGKRALRRRITKFLRWGAGYRQPELYSILTTEMMVEDRTRELGQQA